MPISIIIKIRIYSSRNNKGTTLCSIDWCLEIGVLLYELLHDYSPFGNSENINEIFQNIIINKFFVDDKLNLSNDCINLINLIKKLFEFDDEKRNKNFNSSLDFEQFKKYESNSNVDLIDKIVILILYFKKWN